MDCGLSVSSVHGILQARILKWVATSGDLKCSFLQWIFPTQRLNPGLPHHRWILYHLSHQGSPKSKGNQKQKHEYACTNSPYGCSLPTTPLKDGASQVVLGVKNLPAKAENLRDQVRSLGQEDPLDEGMATHSSILVRRIPWTEEPRGLQSMGLESDIAEHNRRVDHFLPAPGHIP